MAKKLFIIGFMPVSCMCDASMWGAAQNRDGQDQENPLSFIYPSTDRLEHIVELQNGGLIFLGPYRENKLSD